MAVPKPPITAIDIGTANIWQGKGMPKKALVLHIAEGSLAGCDSWFQNPAAQASSNYCVGLNGMIHQYVDPAGPDAPFANGIMNQPDAVVQALYAANGNQNPNWWSISIEHEGSYQNPTVFPPAQLAASAWLSAWLCETFSIAPDAAHVTGHYQYDNVTRHNCPGLDAMGWHTWIAAVQAHLNPAPAPTDPRIAEALTALSPALIGLQQAIHVLSNPPAVLTDAFTAGARGVP